MTDQPLFKIVSTYEDGTTVVEGIVPLLSVEHAINRVKEFRADQNEGPTVFAFPLHREADR